MDNKKKDFCIRQIDSAFVAAENIYDKIVSQTNSEFENYFLTLKGEEVLVGSDGYWNHFKQIPPCLDIANLLTEWCRNDLFIEEIEINWLENNSRYFDFVEHRMNSHYNYLKQHFNDMFLLFFERQTKVIKGIEILHDKVNKLKGSEVQLLVKVDFIYQFFRLESMVEKSMPSYIRKLHSLNNYANNNYTQFELPGTAKAFKIKQYSDIQIEDIYNQFIEHGIMDTDLNNFKKIINEQPDAGYEKIHWTDRALNKEVTKTTLIEFIDTIFDNSELLPELRNRFIIKYFDIKKNGLNTDIKTTQLTNALSSGSKNGKNFIRLKQILRKVLINSQ